MTNLKAAKAKVDQLVAVLDRYGPDVDKARNLAWEAKKLLEKVKR